MYTQNKWRSESPLVTIFMPTYNGEKYIYTQIESIQQQTYTNWELIIRDDVSTDNSVSIIQEFERNDTRITLLNDNKGNLGVCYNIDALMQYQGKGNYFMFADQDDIWLPTKIEASLKKMREIEKEAPGTPCLTYTHISFVNDAMKVCYNYKSDSLKPDSKYFLTRIIHQPWIMGCTMFFNQALLELVRPIPVTNKKMYHDPWVGILAALTGKIGYVPSLEILHRIHATNVSAPAESFTLFFRIKRGIKLLFQDTTLIERNQQFLELIENRLFERHLTLPQIVYDYKALLHKRGISAVFFGIQHRFFSQTPFHTFKFYWKLLVPRPKKQKTIG